MSNNLPSGYKELQYIESSGTQYIDTGIKCISTNDLYLDYALLEYDVNDVPIGLYINGNPTYPLYTASGSKTVIRIANYDTTIDTYNTDRHTLLVKYSSNVYSYDGGSEKVFTGSFVDLDGNYFLCARNTANAASNFSNTRFYNFKAYNGTTMIRNLVPAIKLGDSAVGMYDTVDGQFYNNAGTGTFIAGPATEVEYSCYKSIMNASIPRLPSAYQEIEYLQSSGTQYIDTGFISQCDEVVELDFQYESGNSDQNRAILGTYDGSTTSTIYNLYGNNGTSFFFIQGNGSTAYTAYTYLGTTRTKMVHNIASKILTLNGATQSAPPTMAQINNSWYLFNANKIVDSRLPSIAKVYSFTISRNGSLIMSMVPAKRISDSVLGMYDINNSGKNLYDLKVLDGTLSQVDGVTVSSSSGNAVSDYIDTSTNKTFIISNATSGKNVRVFKYGINKTFIDASTLVTTGTAFTLEESVKYIRIQFNYTSSSLGTKYLQLEAGSEATSYEPFPFYQNAGTGTFTAGDPTTGTTTYNCYRSKLTIDAARLPSEYQELEYISTDGTSSYINPNVTIDSSNIGTTKIELVNAGAANGGSISGASKAGNLILWGGLTAQGSGTTRQIYYSNGSSEVGTTTYAVLADFHKFVMDAPNHIYGVYKEDGTTVYEKTDNIYYCQKGDTFILGGFSAEGLVTCTNYAQKVKSFKMWQDGVAIRNMVPAKRISDSVLGMYDLVTDTFFTNAGSGTITAGDPVTTKTTYTIYKQLITA